MGDGVGIVGDRADTRGIYGLELISLSSDFTDRFVMVVPALVGLAADSSVMVAGESG